MVARLSMPTDVTPRAELPHLSDAQPSAMLEMHYDHEGLEETTRGGGQWENCDTGHPKIPPHQ